MIGDWVNPFTKGRIIKKDCAISEYLKSKGEKDGPPILSRTDLLDVLACPSKFIKGARHDDRKTWQTDFGSLFDCLLLQPHKIAEYYKLAPTTYETKKRETKEWTWRSSTCRDWRDEQKAAGFEVCAEEDLTESKEAVKALMNHPEHGEQIQRLINDSEKQVFSLAEYHDKKTGVMVYVKVLTDIVPALDDPDFNKSLFDLKTARSASPWDWTWAVFNDSLHVQAALNLDIYTAATGEDRVDFRHLIVENTAPWEPAKRFLSEEFVNLGRETYLAGLKTYCQCVADKAWPSYRDPDKLLLTDGFECVEPVGKMIKQAA